MRVSLENIAFNYEKDLSKTGAFYLRRNETQIVPIPEWRRECCSNPECAPGGYVIANLPEVLTIKAGFVCDDPTVPSVYIRALEPADGTNVLGHVVAKEVTLTNGRADLVPFDLPLARTRIRAAGISVSNLTWKWQFSEDSESWIDLQTTHHRIYTVLEMPSAPWEPRVDKASNIQVPWTEVLDYACEWASGVKEELDEAAAKVTHGVYGLGQKKLVRWDGAASYAHDEFDCTSFLQLLSGEAGNGHTLNCEDCATVVSTFSNVLGCDLWQSKMGTSFLTNPILLIGATEWICKRFGKHEVAWEEDCGTRDPLFDACLKVDADDKPGSGNRRRPLQPTNLVFTSRNNDAYRFFLVNKGTCEPQQKKKRRSFGVGPLREHRITDEAFLNFLKEHYEFNEWKDISKPGHKSLRPSSLLDLKTTGDAFQDWDNQRVKRFKAEDASSTIEALLKRDQLPPNELVSITVYECIATEKASEFLLELLGEFEPLDFRLTKVVSADVAFVAPDETTVLFKSGNFVAAIRSVGRERTEVIPMAAGISNYLASL